MLKYEKQELVMEVSSKKRIEFICDFVKLKPTIINGNAISIKHTNLTYIEPHRIIVNNIIYYEQQMVLDLT